MCVYTGQLPGEPGLQGCVCGLENIPGSARCPGADSHCGDAVPARDPSVCGSHAVHTMLYIPCPCRWLVKKRRREKALSVLSRIRCSTEQEVQEEFNEIVQSTKSGSEQRGVLDSVKMLLEWRVFQRYKLTPLDMS